MSTRLVILAVVGTLGAGCTAQRADESAPVPSKATPTPAKSEPAPVKVEQPPPPTPPAGAPSDAPLPPKAEPLTPEEIALIEADPKTLTPERRRLRAFALRKKIMQNPDSPSARALEDLRKAAEAGEIQPPDFGNRKGPWLEAPSKKPGPPADGQPPAGAPPDDGTIR